MQALVERAEPLDRRAIELYAMSDELLMEHAAMALATTVRQRQRLGATVLIVCGVGHNGADGLAAARLLANDFCPLVYLAAQPKSGLAQCQYVRLERLGIAFIDALPTHADVVIDALYGSGLSCPLSRDDRLLIEAMNALSGLKIACDIPSGLANGMETGALFRADCTVTMGAAKTLLLEDRVKEAVGEIIVADLGLPAHAYESAITMRLARREDLRLPHRLAAAAHKGHYGHAAILAGDKPGAALLAAHAALAYGVGLVSVVAPQPPAALGMEIMHAATIPPKTTAIALGMGLGSSIEESELVRLATEAWPVLLDADLLDHPAVVAFAARKGPTIVTPHPLEFLRLAGRLGLAVPDIEALQLERFRYAQAFGAAYPQLTLVLKGANPIIVQGERLVVVDAGTPALAKGGSGDVLVGMIVALLAQGWEPFEAAWQGVLAHALAAQAFGTHNYALTPTALIEEIKRL